MKEPIIYTSCFCASFKATCIVFVSISAIHYYRVYVTYNRVVVDQKHELMQRAERLIISF